MRRTVVDFTFAIELLEHLIDQKAQQPTTLIICAHRRDFLRQIAPAILTPRPQEIPGSQESVEDDELPDKPIPHPFLVPTLRLIASAKAIKLVFCASIDSLRAILSTDAISTSQGQEDNIGLPITATLLIMDLVLLHHATSEFSVQGLSRTFACAVEAAARNSMHLCLVECKDAHDTENPNRGLRLWDSQVPLLSGSVRLGGDGAGWAGRVISVKRIASRWFIFEQEKTDAKAHMAAPSGEEMLV